MRIKNGKIQIKNYNFQYWTLNAIIFVLAIITIYSFTTLGLNVEKHNPIFDSHYFRIGQMIESFLKFDLDLKKYFSKMIVSLISTFGLAFLSTVLGLIFGVILALMLARNLSNRYISDLIRGMNTAVRAIPTFLIVLLCISIYGMSGTSAVIGMTFHSTAFFVKVLGETFEEVDEGALEGIKSLGGSWIDLVYAVVLPSSITKIVAWSAFRLEINFGVAVIMGPFAAVQNSIGSDLKRAVSTYNFTEIFLTITVIFMTMYGLQYLAEQLKKRAKID